jgi:hypothetical protein
MLIALAAKLETKFSSDSKFAKANVFSEEKNIINVIIFLNCIIFIPDS